MPAKMIFKHNGTFTHTLRCAAIVLRYRCTIATRELVAASDALHYRSAALRMCERTISH